MERPIRLHLGSGRHPWPSNWVDIDLEGEVDIKHDVTKLPMFEDGSVDEIQAIHLFEHLPRLEVEIVLKEWKRVLKIGGKLVLEMPSMDKIAQLIVNGEKNLRLTLLGIFGDPRDGALMQHQWCWTNDEIEELFKTCGLEVAFTEPVFHISDRDFRVEATKWND